MGILQKIQTLRCKRWKNLSTAPSAGSTLSNIRSLCDRAPVPLNRLSDIRRTAGQRSRATERTRGREENPKTRQRPAPDTGLPFGTVSHDPVEASGSLLEAAASGVLSWDSGRACVPRRQLADRGQCNQKAGGGESELQWFRTGASRGLG